MITALLPVRPAPRPTEPLTSFAQRIAKANGISRVRVLPRHRHDIDVPPAELATVAALADLDTNTAGRLTMNRYPLGIRGHGPQRRHGWRLHFSVKWICPSCTLTTGHTELLWQTALMPVCLRCGCYLARAEAPHLVRATHPTVLEVATVLGSLAEAAIGDPRTRRRLYYLRRRCQRLAATIVNGAPAATGDRPQVDIPAARAWGAYPSPDPATVATLLTLAGAHLIREKHPKPAHPRSPQTGDFTPADRERLTWFLTRIRHHVTRDRLRTGHVPTLLPLPDTVQPRRPGQWLSLTRAATALNMLISSVHDQDATPGAATRALGVTGIPLSVLIDGIHTGLGLRQQDADLLATGLDTLITTGLVDYQRRRDTLRPVTRLPRGARHSLPADERFGPPSEQLALGWVWTRFTAGPMRSSLWPDLPDRDVHAFDARLDPETRLVLHETGQQLLADADLLTIPTTEATWSGITRRYG